MRLCALVILAATPPAVAAGGPEAAARLPVREVTVFKDGHAFVLHEGSLPTDAAGHVVLDSLPTPVLGTFWPYSVDRRASLVSVVAGRRKRTVDRTASTLRDLLEANIGAEVLVTEDTQTRYPARVVGLPKAEPTPSAETPMPTAALVPERPAAVPTVVLLRTDDGLKVVPLERIRDVTFKSPPRERGAREEEGPRLVLNLAWRGAPAREAEVGLVYVQRGLRWIPSYKVSLGAGGRAAVALQATLVNELADLEDATVHLVIGVPTFAFKDTPDPMALQDTFSRLSAYFDEGGRLANAFTNAVMTQMARMTEAPARPAGGEAAAELALSSRHEDLYVFTVPHVTLARGERMVLRVAERELAYTDVFTLELPLVAPREVPHMQGAAEAEAARLLAAPRVMHKIRLANDGPHPLTTAPALVLRDGRALAQGMMTYAPAGGTSDVTLTAAVDVQARRTETETGRALGALRWDGSDYARIDLAGAVSLTNRRAAPVTVEVVRHVVGTVDSADHGGVARKGNALDAGEDLPVAGLWHWPGWWWHVNPAGGITWRVDIPAGGNMELAYRWHYFWR